MIFDCLTARELEITLAIAAGETRQAIAKRLKMREKTFDTHRTNIRKKLGVKGTVQLALIAIREGYISVHDLQLDRELDAFYSASS